MTWKNWGDHPVVVTISVLAGLAGLIALGYTVFSPSSTQQTTKSNDVPSINASNGNVQVGNNNSVTNNTTINKRDSGLREKEIRRYEGWFDFVSFQPYGILSNDFTEFANSNSNKIVYLDVTLAIPLGDPNFSELVNNNSENKGFAVWRCGEDNYSINNPPSVFECGATFYSIALKANSESNFSCSPSYCFLKGYFSISSAPPTRADLLNKKLTAVDIKDVW